MSGSSLLAIIIVVVWVFAIIWVHNDAARHSSQSEGLWALVIVFGFILGLLLYILIGRDEYREPSDWRRS